MRRWFKTRRARRLAARTNAEWADALRAEDPDSLAELRLVLVEALRPMLRRKAPAQADALAEDFAQDALLHILDRLDTFRGEARFTTWAAKVAVRLALSEFRRLRWKDVSLDDLLDVRPDGPVAAEPDPASPEAAAMTAERVALMRELVAEVLTERQRTAIEAVMLHGMPIEEAARRMDTNRNALYKLLHDARQRLKQALEARGLGPDDLLPDD
jgi:RNA polymerase sigma-70 factor (ECF subfamily)